MSNKVTGYMIPTHNLKEEMIVKIHQMHEAGFSVKEIADILGIRCCEVRSKKEEE